MRKTFNVQELKNKVNEANRASTCSKSRRGGANGLLESILHDTGNYKGFQYLLPKDVPHGEKPGINFFGSDGGCGNDDPRFTNTDETRIVFN
jgi:hypothetical protein